MNFYFCESCGKRITQSEIDSGLGKNKNLKGVFCKTCSIGVSTMNTLPLTDEAAKEILKQSEATKPSYSTERDVPLKRSAKRQTSSRGIPLPGPKNRKSGPSRTIKRNLEPSDSQRGTPKQTPATMLAGFAIGVVVLLGITIYLATSNGKEKSDPTLAQKKSNTLPSPKSKDSISKTPPKKQAPIKHPPQKAPPAVRENDAPQKNEDPDQNGDPAKALDKKDPLKTEPVSKNTATATPKTDDAPAREPSPESSKNSAPVPDTKYKAIFNAHLIRLLDALKQNDLDSASKIATQMANDDTLTIWKGSGQTMPGLVAVFHTEKSKQRKKMSALVGKKTSFQTTSGTQKGRVLSVDETALKLQQEYVINRKVRKGPIFTIRWTTLTKAERERRFSPSTPQNKSEWAAQVLAGLAFEDLAKTEKALQACSGHAAAEPLQEFLAQARDRIEARQAEQDWNALQATSSKTLTEKKARDLLEQLDRLEANHGHRPFLKDALSQRTAVRKKIREASLFSFQALKSLFKGQLKTYDPRTRKATLYYNFKHAHQLEDFQINITKDKPIPHIAKGMLRMAGGPVDTVTMNRFMLSDLEVKFVMLSRKTNKVQDALAICFGRTNNAVLRFRDQDLSILTNLTEFVNPEATNGFNKLKATASITMERPDQCRLIVRTQDNQLLVSVNGRQVMKESLSKVPAGSFFSLGTGSGALEYGIGHLTFTGYLDAGWVKSALAMRRAISELSGPQNVWISQVSNSKWNAPGNWSLKRVPQTGDNVIFARSASHCEVTAGSVAKDLKTILIGPSYAGTITFAPNFSESSTQELSLTGDLMIMGGTVIVSGHVEETGGDPKGTGVTFSAKQFMIGKGAILHSIGRGFPKNMGPSDGRGSGGGHGGRAADGRVYTKPYGDAQKPITLGSGSGSTSGGGAITIDVSKGKVVVHGKISVNGRSAHRAGGGGSIFILCQTFSGAGILEANGGSGTTGGAGGRIAVHSGKSTFTGTYECSNGRSSGSSGRPGSLYLSPGSVLDVKKIIALAPGEYQFERVIVRKGARLELQSDSETGRGCTIKANRIEIEKGGVMMADGLGYGPEKGPAGNTGRAGGSHGGKGGNNKKPIYGSKEAPITSGSGSNHSWGGGAIFLDLTDGLLLVEGILSSNGARGSIYSGGAAGGSIFVRCGRFEGTGKVEVKGGNHSGKAHQAGGGGRIAIYCKKKEFSGTISVKGGVAADGGKANGEDGTLLISK